MFRGYDERSGGQRQCHAEPFIVSRAATGVDCSNIRETTFQLVEMCEFVTKFYTKANETFKTGSAADSREDELGDMHAELEQNIRQKLCRKIGKSRKGIFHGSTIVKIALLVACKAKKFSADPKTDDAGAFDQLMLQQKVLRQQYLRLQKRRISVHIIDSISLFKLTVQVYACTFVVAAAQDDGTIVRTKWDGEASAKLLPVLEAGTLFWCFFWRQLWYMIGSRSRLFLYDTKRIVINQR